MDLKKIISKVAKKAIVKEASKGAIGESLPVQPTLMVKLMNVKGKLAAALAAVAALIAAVSELM
jgi:hypothetical protein